MPGGLQPARQFTSASMVRVVHSIERIRVYNLDSTKYGQHRMGRIPFNEGEICKQETAVERGIRLRLRLQMASRSVSSRWQQFVEIGIEVTLTC